MRYPRRNLRKDDLYHPAREVTLCILNGVNLQAHDTQKVQWAFAMQKHSKPQLMRENFFFVYARAKLLCQTVDGGEVHRIAANCLDLVVVLFCLIKIPDCLRLQGADGTGQKSQTAARLLGQICMQRGVQIENGMCMPAIREVRRTAHKGNSFLRKQKLLRAALRLHWTKAEESGSTGRAELRQ